MPAEEAQEVEVEESAETLLEEQIEQQASLDEDALAMDCSQIRRSAILCNLPAPTPAIPR